MPKGFSVKKFGEMSAIEGIPYRPWCEDLQERPVDFSLKKKKDNGESCDKVGSFPASETSPRLRTPDSGFSSPSSHDFLKRHIQTHADIHYQGTPEEQTAPLSLVKKKIIGDGIPKSPPSKFNSRDEDSRYFIPSHMSSLQLLSSALYWKHRQDMQAVSSINSLVNSAYDLNFNTQTMLSSPTSSMKSQYSPVQTTPTQSCLKSPDCQSVTPTKRKTTIAVTPEKKTKSVKKTKASRRLTFDEDKTSPVSGTIIRELEEGEEPMVIRKGDIDPEYNFVEVTEEAKQELSKIENKIGDYVCRLCKELYDDAFSLAQHRCSRIIHVEYRCPECDKVFNCPANLASHRRWHKPKGSLPSTSKAKDDQLSNDSSLFSKSIDASHDVMENQRSDITELPELLSITDMSKIPEDSEGSFECSACLKKFKRNSYLRKHMTTHHHLKQKPEEYALPKLLPFLPTFDPNTSYNHQLSTLAPMLPSPPFSRETFHCRLCPLSFLSAGSLHLHTSTVHGTDIQNDMYSQKSSLRESPPRSTFGSLHHRPSQILAPS